MSQCRSKHEGAHLRASTSSIVERGAFFVRRACPGVMDNAAGIGVEAANARLVGPLWTGADLVVIEDAAVFGIDAMIAEDVSALLAGGERVVDESSAILRTDAGDGRAHGGEPLGVVMELRLISSGTRIDSAY